MRVLFLLLFALLIIPSEITSANTNPQYKVYLPGVFKNDNGYDVRKSIGIYTFHYWLRGPFPAYEPGLTNIKVNVYMTENGYQTYWNPVVFQWEGSEACFGSGSDGTYSGPGYLFLSTWNYASCARARDRTVINIRVLRLNYPSDIVLDEQTLTFVAR